MQKAVDNLIQKNYSVGNGLFSLPTLVTIIYEERLELDYTTGEEIDMIVQIDISIRGKLPMGMHAVIRIITLSVRI